MPPVPFNNGQFDSELMDICLKYLRKNIPAEESDALLHALFDEPEIVKPIPFGPARFKTIVILD